MGQLWAVVTALVTSKGDGPGGQKQKRSSPRKWSAHRRGKRAGEMGEVLDLRNNLSPVWALLWPIEQRALVILRVSPESLILPRLIACPSQPPGAERLDFYPSGGVHIQGRPTHRILIIRRISPMRKVRSREG